MSWRGSPRSEKLSRETRRCQPKRRPTDSMPYSNSGSVRTHLREPLYILGAAPNAQSEVLTLTRQEGVRQLLEHPPFIRYEGWNLVTLEQAELASGPRLHIQNGERKFFDLH